MLVILFLVALFAKLPKELCLYTVYKFVFYYLNICQCLTFVCVLGPPLFEGFQGKINKKTCSLAFLQ